MTIKQLLTYALFLEIAVVSVGVLVERRLGLGYGPSEVAVNQTAPVVEQAAMGLPVPSVPTK